MKFSKHNHFSDLDLKDSPDPGPHWATQADRSHGAGVVEWLEGGIPEGGRSM